MTEMRVTRNDEEQAATIYARFGQVRVSLDQDDETSAEVGFTVEQAMAIMAQLGAAIVEAQEQD